jgi:hypothetical protein
VVDAAAGLREEVFVFAAADFAAVVFAAVVFAAVVFADVDLAALVLAAAVFAAADVAGAFVSVVFAAGVFAAAALRVGRGARPDVAAGVPAEDPRCSDAPVPVPSAASSSYSERETEVTQTTYQCPPPERSPLPFRSGFVNWVLPERRITIALRPCQWVGAERAARIS